MERAGVDRKARRVRPAYTEGTTETPKGMATEVTHPKPLIILLPLPSPIEGQQGAWQ